MPIPELKKFREKYPEYNDLSNLEVANALARRFQEYSDLPERITRFETGEGPFEVPGEGKVKFHYGEGIDPTELRALQEELTGATPPVEAPTVTPEIPVEYEGRARTTPYKPPIAEGGRYPSVPGTEAGSRLESFFGKIKEKALTGAEVGLSAASRLAPAGVTEPVIAETVGQIEEGKEGMVGRILRQSGAISPQATRSIGASVPARALDVLFSGVTAATPKAITDAISALIEKAEEVSPGAGPMIERLMLVAPFGRIPGIGRGKASRPGIRSVEDLKPKPTVESRFINRPSISERYEPEIAVEIEKPPPTEPAFVERLKKERVTPPEIRAIEELRGEPAFVREEAVTPKRGPGIEESTQAKPLEPEGGIDKKSLVTREPTIEAQVIDALKYNELFDADFVTAHQRAGSKLPIEKVQNFGGFSEVRPDLPINSAAKYSKYKYVSPKTGKTIYVLERETVYGADSSMAEVWHFADDFSETRAQEFLKTIDASSKILGVTPLKSRPSPSTPPSAGGEVPPVEPPITQPEPPLTGEQKLGEAIKKAKIVKVPKRRVSTENQSASEFIRNEGGISVAKAGDLKGDFMAVGVREGGKKGVVKMKAGESPDIMAQKLHEAGFIEEPDPALVVEVLNREVAGEKVYSKKTERRFEIEGEREVAIGAEVDIEAQVKAKVADLTEGRVPLEYGGQIFDSAVVEKGGIRLKGDTDVLVRNPNEILSIEKRPELAEEAPFEIPSEKPVPSKAPLSPEEQAAADEMRTMLGGPKSRFERTEAGMQGVLSETPQRTVPKTPLKPRVSQASTRLELEKAAEMPDLSQTSFLDLTKKGFGSETGAVGKLTPEQVRVEAEARAARKEIYRRISAEATKTGESLEAIAERMKVPPGVFEKLQAEQEGAPVSRAEFTTSIKNAVVDEELAKMGLPAATRGEKLAFEDARAWGAQKMTDDPFAGQKLLDELSRTDRPPTGREVGLLTHEWTRLRNERTLAEIRLEEAQKIGDKDAINQAKAAVDAVVGDVARAGDVLAGAGTESSHSLAFRKMMMKEDYSLAAMERKAAVSKGRPLSEAERAEVKTLHEKIASTQKAFDDYMAKAEVEKAEAASKMAHFELSIQAKERPIIEIEPRVRSLMERIVISLEKEAEAASVRFNARMNSLSANPVLDPALISDGAIMVAAKIARGGLEFGKWSIEMINKHGPKIEAYLKPIWDAADKLVDKHTKRMAGPSAGAVRRAVKGMDRAEQRKVATERIVQKIEAGETADVAPLAQRLARLFIEDGIKERNALIDAVHKELKRLMPDMTRREVMDAISGYGKYKQLTKEEISVQLRDLKGQMQQVAKLEDIEAREPPKKTGVERRTPSDEERRLIQQVNEAKRRFGIVVTDPATQLKSALEARKTYYRNQIADLEAQIAAKEKFVKERTAPPTDAELQRLKARRDALKADFDEIFGSPGLTDQQRMAMAMRGVERSIADLEQRIKTGDIGPRARVSKTPSTPELEAARARRDALKEELQHLRDLATPKKTPEQIALQSLKTRLKNNTADLLDRIARGDFSKKPKREVRLDPEAVKAQFENAQAKTEFHKKALEYELAQRSLPKKIIDGLGELYSAFVSLKSSFDISFGRQAIPMGLAHPIRLFKEYPTAFKAFTKKGAYAAEQEVVSRPRYPEMKRYGLAITGRSEFYPSSWAEKIPGVGISERSFSAPLRKLRADSYDSLISTAERWIDRLGLKKLTGEEKAALANYVNISTGHGKMPAAVAAVLGKLLWAPKLRLSRIQILAGQPYYGGSWRTRAMIAGDQSRAVGSAIVVYTLAKAAGAEIETDRRSSDFLKVKFDGKTRLDPLGGLVQLITMLSRVETGETKTLAKGKVVPIRGEKTPYGGATVPSVIGNYLRSGAHPVLGAVLNQLTGKNVVGEQVYFPETLVKDLLGPLNVENIYEIMVEHDMPADLALAIATSVGIGVQIFNPREKKKFDRRTFAERIQNWNSKQRGFQPNPLSEVREGPR